MAVIYLALAQFVIWLNDPVQLGAGFWPAAGLSLALLLLLNRRRWPWVLGGVALAEFGGDLIHGYPLAAIVMWTVGNVVEPLVGALLIQRFSSRHGHLTPVSRFIGFIAFGVVAGPLVGATIGSLGSAAYGSAFDMVWPKYVVGDALGVLVVAPVVLTWRERPANRRRLEAALLGFSATVATVLVFQNWDVVWDVTLPYLILPFLTWAGLRFGVRGVALTAFVIANIANASTALGYGPFAITGGTDQAVTLLQVFLVITLASAFLLASLASDLTDARAMARREARHHAEVERNREFRDAYLGMLSHEVRTPITTIYGMSHLLRKTDPSADPTATRRYIDAIGKESDRLQRLTEDLVVLSRADGDRLDVAANPIAIAQLVREVVESERARSAGHDIEMVSSSPLPVVRGEEVYVEQVVRNYLSNAAKYSPIGTTITVRAAAEAGGVAVRVTDAGPGLPAGEPERLFDLFYRAPEAIGSTAGAGIGLFVCRKLVEAMGGRVWAASLPAGGAEFGFWLPKAVDEEANDEDEYGGVPVTGAGRSDVS